MPATNLKFWVLVVAFAAGIAVGAKAGLPARIVVATGLVFVVAATGALLGFRRWGSGRSTAERISPFLVVYVLLVATFGFAGLTAGATAPTRSPATAGTSTGANARAGTATSTNPLTKAAANANPVQDVRQYISESMKQHLPANEAGLMMGVIIGDTTNITPETKADFKTTGLSHILAVSGMNVTILVMAIGLFFGRLLNRFGGTAATNRATRAIAYLLTTATITAYMIVCGLQASIVRAGLMGIIALTAINGARRVNPPAALAAAAFVLLAMDPGSLFDVGFQLSFVATVAIIVFNQPLLDYISATPKTPSLIANLLSVTIAAQLGVAPILAATFGRLSLITFAANVAVEPAIAPTQVIGMVIPMLNVISPTVAAVAAYPAHIALSYIATAARWFAAWPFASVATPMLATPALTTLIIAVYYLLLAAVYIFHANRPPKRSIASAFPGRRLARTATIAIVILPLVMTAFGCQAWRGRPPQGLRVTFLDVGQGDAALIQAQDGATILVDGGPHPDSVEPTLRAYGVNKVNLLITSHQHSDHTNGLAAVARDYIIERAVIPPPEIGRPPSAWSRALSYLANRGAKETTAAEGERINVGKYLSVEILSPDPGEAGMGDPNNGAVVAIVRYKKVKILFAGDIDMTTEEDLINDGQVSPVDVFKVPHHGSRTGADPRFLSLIQPKVAVISVGAGNPYHHPAPTTLDALRRIGTRIFRTDQNGSVTIESDGATITTSSQK